MRIPNEAFDEATIAVSAVVGDVTTSAGYAVAAVEAAAPLVVAAELERLVEETDWAWAVGNRLRLRAAELRGGVSGGQP